MKYYMLYVIPTKHIFICSEYDEKFKNDNELYIFSLLVFLIKLFYI